MTVLLNKGDLIHVPAGTKIYRSLGEETTRFEYKILNSPNYFLVLGTREPHPGTEPKNAYYISHDGQNWFVYQDKCYAANNIGVSA
jgi:hypothetical protein